jgi:hypothetical protein
MTTDAVDMKQYVDSKCADFEKVCVAKHAGTDHALDLASTALDKRLEGMNEFRNTLRDQAGGFLTRSEYNFAHEKISTDVAELKTFRAVIESKASQTSMMITMAIALIGLLVSVVSLFFKH